MIPPFMRQLEERVCAVLMTLRPERAAEIRRLARAWELGTSAVDELLAQELIGPEELARALGQCPPLAAPWGPFLVTGEQGRGAAGVVFRARRLEDGAPCALKLLRPAAPDEPLDEQRARRFRREAHVLGRLDHPGVVRLLDAGDHEGLLYLATEWVGGGSLAPHGGRCTPRQALHLIASLAGVLGYTHGAGVIHRDLKPANVLLAADGRPLLVDFGLAKDQRAETLTRSRTVLGTAQYAAPEQLGGARDAGPAVDVFGLAALLHFLLVGAAPFPAASLAELLAQVRRGCPPLPAGLGLSIPLQARLNALLRQALDPDPRVRPRVAELEQELAACAAAAPG